MKVLQINTVLNSGSTGKIAEQIGQVIIQNDGESYIAASRFGLPSQARTIRIGNKLDIYRHIIYTRIFDKHGFASNATTKKLLKEIEIIRPDIIHLHNIHGYYINIELLFHDLKKFKTPIVWTFHDCWPFTGHCTYFDSVGCEKWKLECFDCPKTKMYPKSWFIDNSKHNFRKKKELFNGLKSMHIVTPSSWLKNNVKLSFLKRYPVSVIHNGIDISIFKPIQSVVFKKNQGLEGKDIILGVASTWDKRKGLNDFVLLANMLAESYQIVLIGLNKDQLKKLPKNIIGLMRTENVEELANWYRSASVFVNPTHQDNFPTTNIEALACGTPVITYDTGGSPEAIDENTGFVVKKGNIQGLKDTVDIIMNDNERFTTEICRERAEKYFNKDDRFMDYYKLYKELTEKDA